MRPLTLLFFMTLTVAPVSTARAAEGDSSFLVPASAKNPWQIEWTAPARPDTAAIPTLRLAIPPVTFAQDTQGLHAAAVEHSEAYQTRAKIHKYASFATLPLFATELALGQSLYDGNGSDTKKGLHAAVGAGLATLFAVNSVTGLWNMFGAEGRREKEGRKLRLVHGLLMLAADAGFVATFATAPESEEDGSSSAYSGRSTHRAIAITSIGLGTAGYLIMLFGNR